MLPMTKLSFWIALLLIGPIMQHTGPPSIEPKTTDLGLVDFAVRFQSWMVLCLRHRAASNSSTACPTVHSHIHAEHFRLCSVHGCTELRIQNNKPGARCIDND